VVNEHYAELMSKQKRAGQAVQDYSAETLTNARWLKRAVEQRNQTTLKISAEIIRHQTDFLDKGLDYLKPLSLRDVAQAVGMHESTVSRVTTGLLISTPRGGMPLKSFFSVNIASRDSDVNASAASVRNMVKKIIAQELPGKPFSDEAISKIISEHGIDLARRTVAKYREMLNIPSSSQRRMQARLSEFR
jgi:RNA polymerase sigma-54 factor